MNPVPPVTKTFMPREPIFRSVEPLALIAATWAFAIGNGNLAGGPDAVGERLDRFDMVVVDGEDATTAEIAELHDRDVTVLAYLSVGTIEEWRRWYHRVERFRLEAWQDWQSEWFADTSRARYRRIIARSVAPRILDKGFDGLFLDNVDMIEPWRHRGQRAGMRKLVRRLDSLVGERLLFAQNGFWGLRKFKIRQFLDGWNREDVTTRYDFDDRRYRRAGRADRLQAQEELERMAALGLFTTATDYTRRGHGPLFEDSVANACAAGALPYVSNIGLTARRLPDPALTCP
jgi:uncharacterized protein (TIGR01370 family)